MKPLAPYFGNRFSTVAGKTKKSARKAKPAVSEMEALEPRLLLSGITAGSKVLKSYQFIDADGDQVTIKLTGTVGKGAGFQVDELGNGFDVKEINLVGGTDGKGLQKANLVIDVKPVRLALSDRTTANDIFSPGYTNIGTITAVSQEASSGTATGASAIRKIALNAAVVSDISLVNTDITGSISLGLGRTQFVDRINTASPTTAGVESSYVPSSGYIDLYDVTANSIGKIVINGAGTSPTQAGAGATAGAFPVGYSKSNDFLGTITVTNDLGGIKGDRSVLGSTVIVGGDMGLTTVGGYNGTLEVGGDLAIQLPYNATGTITAGGHMDLGWGAKPFGEAQVTNANITAGAGISGLKTTGATALTDTIIVPAAYNGTLANTSTASTAGSGIANLSIVNSGVAGFTMVSGNSIGNIAGTDFSANMSVTSGAGGIGNLTATAGDILGKFQSAGNVGNITVRGGNMDADILATSSIGDVSVTNGTLSGSLTAQGAGGIGAISAISFDNGGVNGGAIIGAAIYSGGGIKSITATTTDTNSPAIGSTKINAFGTPGAITATNFGVNGEAINGLTLNAGSISGITAISQDGAAMNGTNTLTTTTGSISNISATGFKGGILGTTTLNSAAKVESISGTSLFSSQGIATLTINATTGISGIIGKAVNASGIGGSGKFTSLTGDISGISGISTALTGVATGKGIDGLAVEAVAGSITDITGTTTGLSVDNHGINNVTLKALTGIGTITGTANAGNGINTGTFNVTGEGANIAAIVAQTNTGTAISGANFTAASGPISAITATSNGVGGHAINGASFTAKSLGDTSVNVSNLQGGYGINQSLFTATAGDIGKITVVNKSLGDNSSAYGIGGNATTFQATGKIGDISVTVAANKNLTAGKLTYAAIQGDVKFTADSDLDGSGDIGSVNVTTTGANGIEGIGLVGSAAGLATFKGQNMGDFTVTMTGTGAGRAVNGLNSADSLIDITGNMGKLTISNNSQLTNSSGLHNAKIDVDGTMGAISSTTNGGRATASVTINAGTISSLDATVGAIGIAAGISAIGTTTITSASSIGNITLTGNYGGRTHINSGTTIGAIVINGDALSGGTIQSGTAVGATDGTITSIETTGNLGSNVTATVGNIGPITAVGNITSTITAKAGNIGAISGQGTGNQSLTLVTAPTTGTIGALSFSDANLANGSVVSVDITNAVTVGAIEVTSTAGNANLTLTGGAALTTVGAVNVDGELNVTGATLNKVTSLASLSAGSLTATGTQVVIGNSAAVGTSVGAIAIGTDLASIASGVTLNDSQYRFNFDTYTATPSGVVAGSDMTAVAEGSWAYQTPASGNSTLGGISFILA